MASVFSPRRAPEAEQSASQISEQIFRLLTAEVARDWRGEVRGPKRFAFPQLIQVQPLNRDGTPNREGFVGCGRDLSPEGIGFYTPEQLSCARAILSFEGRDGSRVSVLTRLRWCRFTQLGWYENGGQFLRALPTPWGGTQSSRENSA